MKVKVTKTMAKAIREWLQANETHYFADYCEMDTDHYQWYVDSDLLDHENDYNWETRKFHAIIIEYPAECYAPARYLTTNDLIRVASRIPEKTLENFMRELYSEIEI